MKYFKVGSADESVDDGDDEASTTVNEADAAVGDGNEDFGSNNVVGVAKRLRQIPPPDEVF